MKGKKGKKSLRDVENFRSTRLKQLSKNLLPSSIGTNSISIQTTSSLPPSLYMVNDSIPICNIVGRYNNFIRRFEWTDTPYKKYDASNLIYIGGGNNVVGGWFYYNNPNGGYTNFNGTILGNVQGYLFLFFLKTNRNLYNRGDVCTQCYKDADPNYVYNECGVFDTNQGAIFAVVISNIAQINSLNRTMASQSSGIFLSNIINDALDANNQTIKSVIDDLKRYDNYTTQILSYDPVNPLILEPDYINFPNHVYLSCQKDEVFKIDQIIPWDKFKLNELKKTFLPESEAKKLTFDDFKLKDGWFEFSTPEADLNIFNYGNPTIRFKQTGSSTITFRNRYFEDTENIAENPKGPRFYGPKYLTLIIRVNIIIPPPPPPTNCNIQ
jgi:hypothetical protein